MLTAKFDPQSFFQRTENVALHVPASEVFSLLKRTIDLPPQWGALVGRTTGDQVAISAGGVVSAEDAEDLFFIRLAPAELKFRLDRLSSRNGFSFDAQVKLRVHPIADRAELAGFLRTVIGSRRVIQIEGLAAHFQPVVHGAVATLVAERDAEMLVDAMQWHSLSEAVTTALQVPLFTSGLSLEGNPALVLESAMYRNVQKTREDATVRQAQHETSRQVREALHVARAEHLDRLADSLARLKEMSAASPGAELPQLIRTFSEHQRGELYQALFASEPLTAQTQWIVASTSDELLFFDAHESDEPRRRMAVSGIAGKARSVQLVDDLTLLVGASRGVCVWPVDHAAPSRNFVTAKVFAGRGGFNSAARNGNILAGTHSEIGIWEWNWETEERHNVRFVDLTENAKAVRGLCVFEGDFYCSVDDRVIRWRSETSNSQPDAMYLEAGAIITALQPAPEGLYAGTSEGDLVFWPGGTTQNPDTIHRGQDRPIESISMQHMHGLRRLVYADTSPRIHARVIGDSFTFHYEAGGQTLRRVKVAPDLIVATNELRDRLFCWSPANPEAPKCIIQVGALTGRNVQDFCLVPAAASA